jgi:hypothetical protein
MSMTQTWRWKETGANYRRAIAISTDAHDAHARLAASPYMATFSATIHFSSIIYRLSDDFPIDFRAHAKARLTGIQSKDMRCILAVAMHRKNRDIAKYNNNNNMSFSLDLMKTSK